ncbi:hypothetical protein ANN_09000 [Periplaneta americana]|uniref:Uncharacterized protein n=1 Tax=Periplaneta americana TaxID=6978 RepID=A0ABQ8TKK6_PERAM|nr:hypothetical protein ANN_09000 [Periplaneta americana]
MDEIQRVYSKLESLFSKFNFPARRIYNVDETEVSTVHTTSRIIASKGTKQVGAIISWERGKNITIAALDLTFCGPLKSAFNKECETFLKTHAAEKITPYDSAKLFNQAYGRVSSVEKATNGFKRNGIWPLNRNVYSDEDFMAAMNLSPPGEGSVLSLIDDDNQIEGTSQQLV